MVPVSVQTITGAVYNLDVPPNVTSLDLRRLVAECASVAVVETALVSDDTGEMLAFESSTCLERVPLSLTLVRSKSWASIPEAMHHPDLIVSENRLRAEKFFEIASGRDEMEEYVSMGCVLSAPLLQGARYTLTLRIETDHDETGELWLGVRSSRCPGSWQDLLGVYFCGNDATWNAVTSDNDAFDHDALNPDASNSDPSCGGVPLSELRSRDVYKEAQVAELLRAGLRGDALARMTLDLNHGTLELWTTDDELLVHHTEPRFLRQDSMRFCACLLWESAVTIVDATVS
eukprot:TRINITY_DN67283_c0_g1_i1.p1 TRINITY_DN67283_c0_g1~~TRINITY_DN67283_c0_g1_i1.p1  ORF type:complete len:318 (+),score=41.35 TRINITY_DN67283_c0_g1_i1:89-955(+)